MAEKLLACGADIEARTKRGFTPYLLCLLEKKEEMAEFLKAKGADVHAEVEWKSETTGLKSILKSAQIGTDDSSPENASP
ncbi:putative ankyrin repeat domain-containing protein 30B-like, partial [Nannospalax galili]|uniref:putative ankyrin repeat domain-containing protein 30B-like n=1 Tax=Nannospalax galili TaxID=1026970 RepID=UPI00111BFA24